MSILNLSFKTSEEYLVSYQETQKMKQIHWDSYKAADSSEDSEMTSCKTLYTLDNWQFLIKLLKTKFSRNILLISHCWCHGIGRFACHDTYHIIKLDVGNHVLISHLLASSCHVATSRDVGNHVLISHLLASSCHVATSRDLKKFTLIKNLNAGTKNDTN